MVIPVQGLKKSTTVHMVIPVQGLKKSTTVHMVIPVQGLKNSTTVHMVIPVQGLKFRTGCVGLGLGFFWATFRIFRATSLPCRIRSK